MDMVENALKLFSTHGIRAVSKNDLQKVTSNKEGLKLPKEEIVQQCVENISETLKKIVPETHNSYLAPTEQIMAIYNRLLHYMLNFNLAFYNDLQKYYTHHYNEILEVLDSTIYCEVKRLLRKGKAQGNILFWLDVDLECTIH